MRIQVLGCSAGIGAGLRTTSLLIDDDILIDCGTGVGDLEPQALRKLRHVFLTHAHLDHIAALPLLVDTLFDDLTDRPLTLHCQEATHRALRRHIFNSEIWPDFFALPDPSAPVLIFERISSGEAIDIGGRRIAAIAVNHTVPAAAYRIEAGGRALAFSGDTADNDTLWAALNRHGPLDLLLVECAFPEAERDLSRTSRHYCPSSLATDIAKLTHRPAIWVTHLKPGAEDATMNEIRDALPGFELRALTGGEVFEL